MKCPMKGRQPGRDTTPAFARERARRLPTPAPLRWTGRRRLAGSASHFCNRVRGEVPLWTKSATEDATAPLVLPVPVERDDKLARKSRYFNAFAVEHDRQTLVVTQIVLSRVGEDDGPVIPEKLQHAPERDELLLRLLDRDHVEARRCPQCRAANACPASACRRRTRATSRSAPRTRGCSRWQ
jgi:hypothetical protein